MCANELCLLSVLTATVVADWCRATLLSPRGETGHYTFSEVMFTQPRNCLILSSGEHEYACPSFLSRSREHVLCLILAAGGEDGLKLEARDNKAENVS